MQTQDLAIDQFELQVPKLKQALKAQAEGQPIHSELEMTSLCFNKDSLLAINESFIQHILNVNPNLLCIYNLKEQHHIYVNRAITSILGYSNNQIQEMPILFALNLCHPEDVSKLLDHFQKCAFLQDNEILETNFRIENRQGEWRWLRWRDTVFSKTNDGKIQAILGTAEDITDRVKAEQEIKQTLAREQEINHVKSNFISILSHDLRTPLTTILGATKILDNIKSDPKIKKRMVAMIEQAVKQANNLISDVLMLGSAESGQVELNGNCFDLANFIKSIVAEMQISTGKKEIIVCTSSAENFTVQLDEKLLTQIFVNLLDNAIKYSPKGSPIYLKISKLQEEILIRIEDRGFGIPEDEQKDIFEYFRRGSNIRRISGTGLGLAIVKQCLEMQKGSIEVESEVDRGTTFTVRLPLVSPANFPLGEKEKQIKRENRG